MILSKLNIYLKHLIVELFLNKGIKITINDVRILKFNMFLLKGFTFFGKSEGNSFLDIESFLFRVSIWESLSSFSLTGEITLSCVHSRLKALSNKALSFDSIELSFKCRRRKKIIYVKAADIPILIQLNEKKLSKELFFELPEITWDKYIGLMGDRIAFDFLGNLRSSVPVSIIACCKVSGENKVPYFNAMVEWDGFSLFHKDFPDQKEMEPRIDRAFLLNAVKRKFGKERTGNYVTIDNLPKNLLNAVICTEDPGYWNHSGISLPFVGLAIGENMRQRKIIRGASTITMQVVRNLFLSHDRNFMRKMEECVITLLLENYYKIDKRTILEIYLNIIEFAPDVYGVNDACRFYFDKSPSELSLTEILVLTYIIPRPKHFFNALNDKTQQLKTNLHNHIRAYSGIMLRKDLINKDEYRGIDFMIGFAPVFGMLDLNDDRRLEEKQC